MRLRLALTATATLLATSIASRADFVQGFETDTSGWPSAPTRVASGTGGITAYQGSWYATTAADSGNFTRFGGYNFGAGDGVPTAFQEYTTSIAIYLDTSGALANDTRFDWDTAINNSSGTFLRDFIFNAGFYNSSDNTGPGAGTDRFVISAGNNSQPGSAYAKNLGHDPIAISTTGWYVFNEHFFDNSGVLAVNMTITDALGNTVPGASWTLSNPSDLIAGVGGNRYGWFDYSKVPSLAIDEAKLTLAPVPEPTTLVAGALLLLPFAAGAVRRFRKTTV